MPTNAFIHNLLLVLVEHAVSHMISGFAEHVAQGISTTILWEQERERRQGQRDQAQDGEIDERGGDVDEEFPAYLRRVNHHAERLESSFARHEDDVRVEVLGSDDESGDEDGEDAESIATWYTGVERMEGHNEMIELEQQIEELTMLLHNMQIHGFGEGAMFRGWRSCSGWCEEEDDEYHN